MKKEQFIKNYEKEIDKKMKSEYDEDDDMENEDLDDADIDDEDDMFSMEKFKRESEHQIKKMQLEIEKERIGEMKMAGPKQKLDDEIRQSNKHVNSEKKKEDPIYSEFLKSGLYDDLMEEAKIRILKLNSASEIRKELTIFSDNVLSYSVFNKLYEDGLLYKFTKIFLEHLRTDPVFEKAGFKDDLDSYVNETRITGYLALMLQNRQFESAKYLLNFFSGDISSFVQTLKNIQENNKSDVLRFICENMKNIHFGNGSLLRSSLNMAPENLSMLIDEFGFDINEGAPKTSLNILHGLIQEGNVKNFNYLINRYSNKINLLQPINLYQKKSGNIFDLIEDSDAEFDFLYSLLSIKDETFLKKSAHERIGEILFKSSKVEKYSTTDIFEKFFAHPSFDHQIFNLGQRFFVYGLMSKMGELTVSGGNNGILKALSNVMRAYLDFSGVDEVPDALKYNVIGAAILLESSTENPSVQDASIMVIKKYKQYINKPNPSGVLPIAQVKPDVPLYRILINNGAIPPEPEPGFFSSMLNFLGGKKKQADAEVSANEVVVRETQEKTSGLGELREKMRADFRKLRIYLENDDIDIEVKVRCENMFLRADKLVRIMDKNNVKDHMEEVHFLTQSFPNYMKKSLEPYSILLSTKKDFGNSDVLETKLSQAQKMCVKHINLLEDQIELIIDNLSAEVAEVAMSDLKIRDRFLQEKFPTSKAEEVLSGITKESVKPSDGVALNEDDVSKQDGSQIYLDGISSPRKKIKM